MKIAFVIACINSKSNGLGGHYFSLLETVNQISVNHEVIIINVGNQAAKALENTNFKIYKLINQNAALIKTSRQLRRILEDEKPDVLHAFDSLAFYWVRIAGFRNKIPFCLTKCGGTNPVYFPVADNLVLYSQENFDYFKSAGKFRESQLSLIPNRIVNFQSDEDRIVALQRQLGDYKDSFKFLRISRIGNYYHKSALQLIKLVKQLADDGIDCCALFVGTIEDKECFYQLKEVAGPNVFFFSSDEFAKNAKTLIDCADAVVGTGRSFMEASAKNKILLCPVKSFTIPLLVDKESFNQVFHFNFSERSAIEGIAEHENYAYIKRIVTDEAELQRLREFSSLVFEDFFDASKIAGKYEEVYRNIKKSKRRYFDFLLHMLFLIRNYYR